MTRKMKVFVRIRPHQTYDAHPANEKAKWDKECEDTSSFPVLDTPSDSSIHYRSVEFSQRFNYDHVFGQDSTQRRVSCIVDPMVEKVLQGTNCCIFAYGQTGSGKTFTMLGPCGGHTCDDSFGLIPKAASELFLQTSRLENDAKKAMGNDVKTIGIENNGKSLSAFEIRLSFVEIYCDELFDLLSEIPQKKETTLKIREADGHVNVKGLTEKKITSVNSLLSFLHEGSLRRATAATNIHEHSSRSHAIVTLTVEHRWVDPIQAHPKCHANTSSERKQYHCRVSRLSMVDLAGSESTEQSHSGVRNVAGCSTNLGLSALGRVLRARGAMSEGGSAGAKPESVHVPYRDSYLTHLLKPCLSGSAEVTMLACVSPSRNNAKESLSTLKFAAVASNITLHPEKVLQTTQINIDPMENDVDDPINFLNRCCRWIEVPGFGEVFARCCGNPADPLVLFIHGSGPTNSSECWNQITVDFANNGAQEHITSFYCVSVDCPGYGQSIGDRQTIRSYPGEFVSQVVRALGRLSCAALVGSSQGAAAVLNVALALPMLTRIVAIIHPVSHAPLSRFSALKPPVLMIYNTADSGHPVSVGRRLRKVVPNSRYYEFDGSLDEDWDSMQLPMELSSMLKKYCKSESCVSACPVDSLPVLTRAAGGYYAWQGQQLSVKEVPREKCAELATEELIEWEGRLLADNTLEYVKIDTGERVYQRPRGNNVVVHINSIASTLETTTHNEGMVLFDDGSGQSDTVEANQSIARAEEEEKLRMALCEHCRLPLLQPVQLLQCRCIICKRCTLLTLVFTHQCPVCGDAVLLSKKRSQFPVPRYDEDMKKRLQAASYAAAMLPAFATQQSLLEKHIRLYDKMEHLVIEYGNTATALGGRKIEYRSIISNIRLEAATLIDPIHRVEFNINPDYAKPTHIAKASDNKGRFSFSYAMQRPFPCQMTVHFASHLGLQPVVIAYVVQTEETFKRIIIQFPSSFLKKEMKKSHISKKTLYTTYSASEGPCHGWIRYGDDSRKGAVPLRVDYISQSGTI